MHRRSYNILCHAYSRRSQWKKHISTATSFHVHGPGRRWCVCERLRADTGFATGSGPHVTSNSESGYSRNLPHICARRCSQSQVLLLPLLPLLLLPCGWSPRRRGPNRRNMVAFSLDRPRGLSSDSNPVCPLGRYYIAPLTSSHFRPPNARWNMNCSG